MNGIPPLSSRDAHASPPQRVLERLHSSAAGLDADEAARRLAAHGYNRLPAPKRQGPLLRLLRQFHNVLLYMMLFASLVTALLGFWVDSAVILLAVVVNALIGFVQEGKAANALDAIRDMLSLHALVLRDGQRQALDAERLVPGDVVLLASGDRVPADLRLFETKNFHVDESALTGESVPVEKGCVAVAIDALLGDRRCMAYSGTLVTSGQARGVVVATAGDTELGRIGTLLREVRTLATPLLRQIASFSRWLALAILLLAGATFVLGTLWQGQPMVDMFMLVVALTASAIPEGLPAIMTVILALGVQRMARRNAIVSRLPAVETLGSVTVICSDKTGTLTRNEMTVQRIVTADQVIEVSGAGYAPLGGFSHNGEGLDPAGRDDLQEIGRAALLCNEARLHQEGEAWQLEGDPTEGALLSLGLKLGLDPQALAAERPRSDAIPFESEHRFMATLHHDHAGQAMVYLKGAPERILDMCEAERVGDSVRPLDPERTADFLGTVHLPDAKAARVLRGSLGRRPGVWADHAAAWCSRRTRRAEPQRGSGKPGRGQPFHGVGPADPVDAQGLRTAERCRTGLRTSGQQTGGSDQPGEGSVAVVRHRQDQLGDIGYLQLLGSQCELPYGKYSAEVRCDLPPRSGHYGR